MRPPWWPVPFSDVQAKVTWETLPAGPLKVGPIEVRGARLRHPGGVVAYRLEHRARAVVVATDVEGGEPKHDAAIRALADGAAVLVHDAQYRPEEYRDGREGWGHSTWEHASSVARDAGVEHLVLTSHEPNRTDDGVDAIVAEARAVFPSVEAAYEGQQIPL
jgi:ribonuclease BN (tRNA processing enzyme)